MHIFFIIQKGSIVPQWAFQVNSAPATAKTWDLKGYMLKVKLCKQFQLVHRLFGKYVPSAHISRTSPRLSLCMCAVTFSINWEATDNISCHLCYVYVCSCASNIFKTNEGATDCEIPSVIRFLNTRNVLPSEIHHQIYQVYGDNVMSDSMVSKWVRMFKEGWENVHDEALFASQ